MHASCHRRAGPTAFMAALLLGACESERAPEKANGGAPAAAAFDEVAGAAQDPAKVEARLRQVMAAILKDPESAQYWNVRGEPTGAICGQVDPNEGGKLTGARPFVVTPEGVGLISATPEIMYGDPADMFPDFYIRWCATPEELAQVGPAIARREAAEDPPPAPDLPGLEAPPPPEAPVPAPAAAPPPLAPAAKTQAAPSPPAAAPKSEAAEEESFSKAVRRPQDPKAGE